MNIKAWILLAGAGLIASCQAQEQKVLNQEEINAKVDSILITKKQELSRQAMEDLDRRIAIDVKVKTDSLYQICQQQAPVAAADNTAPTNTNQP